MIVPREHETAVNKAPVVRALAALLMVFAILSTIARVVTRLLTIRRLRVDDVLIMAATAVCIAQSALVIFEGASGLGKHARDLDTNQIDFILKGQYASDVLYITTLLLAKISATRTLWQMIPRERRRLVIATEGLIGLWALASIATSLFQCNIPRPWDYIDGRCFNRHAFWTYVNVLNVVTDLVITAILIDMFRQMQTSLTTKMMVIGVFGSRIFIIPPVACHIYYFYRSEDSNDPTFHMWAPAAITQVIQCISIMATSTPFLKPLMDNLESGQMIAGDLWQTRTKTSNSRSKTGASSNQASRKRANNSSRGGLPSIATMASTASHHRMKYEMIDMDKSGTNKQQQYKGPTATATATYEPGAGWDRESHTSQTILVQESFRVDVERKSSVI